MHLISHRGTLLNDSASEERAKEAGAESVAPPKEAETTGATEGGVGHEASSVTDGGTTGSPGGDEPSTPSGAGVAPAKGDLPPKPPARRWSWWFRGLVGLALAAPVAVIGLWIAIHEIPWLGPWVADTLRATIGVEAVTKLEEFAYGIQDRLNRTFRSGEAPKARWSVPSAKSVARAVAPPLASGSSSAALAPVVAPFELKDVGPVHQKWSAPGDGVWVPMTDARKPNDETRLYKTLLHPDKTRSWAELFVVAIDLRRVRLNPVLGYQEPRSETAVGREKLRDRTDAREAKIPARDLPDLLAAFNGGFKAEHGHWGMMINGVPILNPRKHACTISLAPDGLHITTWQVVEPRVAELSWYRQTPPCMYENGKMHTALQDPESRNWGATLEGDTVIRRSALGLDAERKVLYFGLSNSTTAHALALGMNHAGAASVAQLDVNWSYPKFLVYEDDGKGGLKASPLAEGFKFDNDEYVGARSMRDFFYLTRIATSADYSTHRKP